MFAGLDQFIVGVTLLPTLNMPTTLAASIGDTAFVAVTLKFVVPPSVEFDDVIVSAAVLDESVDVKDKELGLKTALAPDGKAPALKSAVMLRWFLA